MKMLRLSFALFLLIGSAAAHARAETFYLQAQSPADYFFQGSLRQTARPFYTEAVTRAQSHIARLASSTPLAQVQLQLCSDRVRVTRYAEGVYAFEFHCHENNSEAVLVNQRLTQPLEGTCTYIRGAALPEGGTGVQLTCERMRIAGTPYHSASSREAFEAIYAASRSNNRAAIAQQQFIQNVRSFAIFW